MPLSDLLQEKKKGEVMRRAVRYSLGLLPLAGIAFVCWLVWSEKDHVHDRLTRIPAGWPKENVIAMMGEPIAVNQSISGAVMTWHGLNGIGMVVIDEHDTVVGQMWLPSERVPVWRRLWLRITTKQGI